MEWAQLIQRHKQAVLLVLSVNLLASLEATKSTEKQETKNLELHVALQEHIQGHLYFLVQIMGLTISQTLQTAILDG